MSFRLWAVFSAQKSVSKGIWAVKLRELWGRKFEYAAQILSPTDFQAKERLLAVCMSFSVCKLFCCFLTGWIEGTIILAIMNSLLRSLHDLATELILGKIMYTYLFIYLFIIFYTSVKLCGRRCIWDLKFEEYWEECDQLSDTHVIVKGLNPGLISKVCWVWSSGWSSHCQQQQSYSGLRSPGWSNSTYTCTLLLTLR